MNDNVCFNCGGTGGLPCNRCFGMGQAICNRCNGSGHVIAGGLFSGPGIPGGGRLFKGGPRMPSNIPLGGSRPCRKCDATGKVFCRKCNGSGVVYCLKCQGTGRYAPRQRTSYEEPKIYGTVKWYNADKGFGFIQPDDGSPDVHVGRKNLQNASTLQSGDRVAYHKRDGTKGPWAASVDKV